MESYQDLFIKTYNGIYLRSLSREEISELRERINESTDLKSGEKSTLLRLMGSKPYVIPSNILGPNHFYVARKNGMNIYLFGEYHRKTEMELLSNCTSPNFIKFVDMVKELETNGRCFFDVFIESLYIKHSRRTVVPSTYNCQGSYTINSVLNRYKHCLTRDTRDNHCNNFRFHYVDIRNFLYSLFGFDSPPFQSFKELLGFYHSKPLTRKLYSQLASFHPVTNNSVFHSFILDNPLVKTQIEKSYLKNHIKQYISFNIRNIISAVIDIAFKIFNEVLNLNIAHPLIVVQDMYDKIGVFMLHIISLAVDAYLLARLFKVYDQTKNIDYRGPDRTYNAIVYTGQVHIENIKNFLQFAMGFQIEEVYKPSVITSSCLNINGTPDERSKILNYRPVYPPSPFHDLPEVEVYTKNAFDFSDYLKEGKIENALFEPSYIPDLITE